MKTCINNNTKNLIFLGWNLQKYQLFIWDFAVCCKLIRLSSFFTFKLINLSADNNVVELCLPLIGKDIL